MDLFEVILLIKIDEEEFFLPSAGEGSVLYILLSNLHVRFIY
jgi:hypothetical protein